MPGTTAHALEAVRAALAERPGVIAAYLFGSTARGAPEPADLDIAVMFDSAADAFAEVLALQVELERRAGVPMDVHDFGTLPSDLQFRVLDEGVLLCDVDAVERRRRAVRAQLEYYDFKPYLERIQRGALLRVAAQDRR